MYPEGVTATIKSVKINRRLKKAGVVVEISYKDETWERDFLLQAEEGSKVGIDELKREIESYVLRDIHLDYAFSEVVEKEGQTIPLFEDK